MLPSRHTFVRSVAAFIALVGLVYSVPDRVSARAQLPPNITGPTPIGLGGSYSGVFSISETGYILGSSNLPGDQVSRLFLRKPNGDMVDLGVEPSTGYVSNNGNVATALGYNGGQVGRFYNEATGWLQFEGVPQPINGTIEPNDVHIVNPSGVTSSGAVVGTMWSYRPNCGCSSDGQHFFRWTRDGGIVDLGTGDWYSEIYGFNEMGQFSGTVSGTQPGHAVRWSPEDGFLDLGTLPGHDYNLRAFGMSEAGHVVGFDFFQGTDTPFAWSPASGLIQLFAPTANGHYATNINARGQIAGSTKDGAGIYRPFFMDAATSAVEFITTPFHYTAPAFGNGNRGLNGRGQLVGEGYIPGIFERRAFYWSAADGVVDLGGPDGSAKGITNNGLIAGHVNGQAVIWQVTGGTASDMTPPTVTVTSPSNVMYQSGDVVLASYSCGDDTELVSCSAPVANGAPIDTATPGPHAFTVTAIDRFDNVTTQTVVYNTPDNAGPTVTTNVTDGQMVTQDESFSFQLRCVDAGGVATCSAVDENGQLVRNDYPMNTSAGQHTITITAVDASGNNSNRVIHYTAAPDTFGPTVTIASPLNGAVYAYGDAATVSFSCADQSGIYQCGPAQVQVQFVNDGGALPTLAAGVQTLTVRARDQRGNDTVVSVTYTVLAGPDAIITSPVQGALYRAGESVTAGFTCSSPLGVTQCEGSVPSGSAIDTSAAGDFTFTVDVTDNGGFSRSIPVSYTVLAADVSPVALPTPPPGGTLGPIDIGTLGGSWADPSLISANGIIVGRSAVANDTTGHTFVWTQAKGMTDLGDVNANAVSTNATVVGSVNTPQPIQTQMQVGYRRAFAWTPAGGTRMLASPEFEIDNTPRRIDDIYGGSEASFVNANGLMAGSLVSWRVSFYMGTFAWYGQHMRPVIWKPNGDVVMIPQIGESMWLVGLNDSGQVLLHVQENGIERAKLWSEAGGFVDLGDLGGGATQPTKMHASGAVIGASATTDGPWNPFLWTPTGGMVDIGGQGSAYGVNASGQVLGYDHSLQTYFIWTQSTGRVPVQSFVSGIASPGHIDAAGRLWGEAYTAGYAEKHAAMWAPDGTMTDLGLVDGIRGLSDNNIATGVVGNSAMVWLFPGFTSDATAPVVAVTSLADAATLVQNSSVNAAFSCTDAQGIASCSGTVANGSAIDTSTIGTFVFTASAVDNNGNYTATTTHYTVTAGGGGATPGHMRGEGRIRSSNDPNERQRFAFNVLARPTGQQQLRFNFWTADPDDTPRRTNVFDATSITTMHFSDDAGFVSGSRANAPAMDTVTFSGTGEFNNQPGYTFEVIATDQGEPGVDRDTFSLTVKDGNGAVVFLASGALDSGHIQSLRLPNRHFPPFLSGGPQRVREVEATSTAGAVVTFNLPTAVSETGAALTVTCEPASGSTFPLGRTRGTCTATDANGRTGRMVFAVIVSDNTAPLFPTAPANITVDATGRQGAEVMFALPLASDTADADVVVTCNPSSGRRFPVGTTLVTCKARDNAHNIAMTTFTVTVRDTVAPTIRLTKPTQGAQYRQGSSQVVNYSCTDDVGVTQCTGTVPDGAAIDTSTVGTFVFTVTASDAAGNQTVRTVSYSVKPR